MTDPASKIPPVEPASKTPEKLTARADNNAEWDADDEADKQGHPPVAPKDAGVLDSLGRSISDAITGSAAEIERDKDKPTGRP